MDGASGEAWSAELVAQSVDRSLRDLQTDHVDVVLLHSCSIDKLADHDLLDALAACKQAGKTRFIGYSGDADEAEQAVAMKLFDVLETSLSICDQQAIDRYLPQARQNGLGVIVKRPIANAPWRDESAFYGDYINYARPYIERFRQMDFTPADVGFDGSWVELALRFTLGQPGVSTAITGSINPEHLRENVRIAADGPLGDEVADRLREIWNRHDDGSWEGQI